MSQPTPLLAAVNGGLDARAGSRQQDGRVAEWFGLMAILVQLGLIALVMRNTKLETYALHRVVYVAIVGFVVHHYLPFKWRLPFFSVLSITAMVLVLGETPAARWVDFPLGLTRTGAVVVVGSVFIAICHLPFGFWVRAGLLITAGLFAAVFRAGLGGNVIPAIVWPVLAALFMFRVMVYLYDVTTSSLRPSKSQSLAYFFLLPNVCTLLFPVIDFRTFCQKYYDEEPLIIYQRGAKWMARGVMQLLIYRLVSRWWSIELSEVADGTDLVRFVITNVFLYLKVSGSFHFIIGLLLLFGFNLPETNHRYFLASSFTDYWRRVNIYWRIFIMKVYYYPAFFRFKRLGQTKALIIATLWCFLVTWALHLYQTWWITGTVSWTWPDVLFWTALGLLVLVNSLWELKRNRPRQLSARRYSWREAAGLVGHTAATFAVISVLWSLWSAPTLTQWFHLWSFADWHTLAWSVAVLSGVMIATILFEVLPGFRSQPATSTLISGDYFRSRIFRLDVVQCVIPLALICFATHPLWEKSLNPVEHPRVVDLAALHLLIGDGEIRQKGQGYYENLATADEGAGQFWETMNPKLVHSFFNHALRPLTEAPFSELIPNVHLEKEGVKIDTNYWGMRDQDYTITKPPGTVRLALLGSSHVMGYGLSVEDMFEPRVEARLNSGHRFDGQFEILNFAVSGRSPVGQAAFLENRVPRFSPDVVLLVTHLLDLRWISRDVMQSLYHRIPLPPGFPYEILTQAGVDRRTNEVFAVTRLRAFEPALLSFYYRRIVQECESIHALPICVFLPVPDDLPVNKKAATTLIQSAKEAGFIVVDLSEIYAGQDPTSFMLAERFHHSNAKANALIADALYDRLTTDPQINLLNRARSKRGSVANVIPTAQALQ